MMDKQGQVRLAQRVRRLYLSHDGLPLFCEACNVDAATGLCNGCLRNFQEITNWRVLSHEDRHAVWNHIIETRLVAAREAEYAARRGLSLRRSLPPVELAPETEALPVPEALPISGQDAEPVLTPEVAADGVAPAVSAQKVTSDAAQGDATAPAEIASEEAATAQEAPVDEAATPSGMPDEMGEDTPQEMTEDTAEPPTPGAVPVDVAAARAEQVRAEMVRVVQAALARERKEAAKAPLGPAEVKLKPLI